MISIIAWIFLFALCVVLFACVISPFILSGMISKYEDENGALFWPVEEVDGTAPDDLERLR